MKFPFFATLKEFIITNRKTIGLSVADKLYQFHIFPMQAVRKELGVWITASMKSGYRPKWYERSKGRSGDSQHVFEINWKEGSGAVDWTCKNFAQNKDRFLELILKHTNYTRLAVYDTFIHADYKDTSNGKTAVYASTPSSKWTLIKYV